MPISFGIHTEDTTDNFCLFLYDDSLPILFAVGVEGFLSCETKRLYSASVAC